MCYLTYTYIKVILVYSHLKYKEHTKIHHATTYLKKESFKHPIKTITIDHANINNIQKSYKILAMHSKK